MKSQHPSFIGRQPTRQTDSLPASGGLPRLLVAGMGNLLRGDDGFGVEVVRQLAESSDLPANVEVIEVGIGGIHLVQELMSRPGYDGLLVIDAVDRQSEPGRVCVLEASVPDLQQLPEEVRRDFLADMHYAIPARALVLAKALNVLPAKTWIVGCQPEIWEDYEMGLSQPVQEAIGEALIQIKRLVKQVTQAEGAE